MSGGGRSVYFAFTEGLSVDVTLPAGTVERMRRVVDRTRTAWTLERSRWVPVAGATSSDLCSRADEHNRHVRMFYEQVSYPRDLREGTATETLTDAALRELLPSLALVEVPPALWTADYYRGQMEELYEALRGRGEPVGVDLGCRPLTPKQAGAIVWLLEPLLQPRNVELDLEVPRGHDALCGRDEYERCDRASCRGDVVHVDDVARCTRRRCPRRSES